MTYLNRDKIRISAKRQNIIDMFGGRCSICGKTSIIYDLHHIYSDEKDFTIGSKDLRISTIIKEASKCILLCRNCHREIHYPYDDNNLTTKQVNKNRMLDYLNTRYCVKCGYSKSVGALEFHHVDSSTKLFPLSDATIHREGTIVKGVLSQDVKTELDKCVVLCSQCHAEIHYNIEFHENYSNEIKNKANTLKEVQSKIDREMVKSLYLSGLRVIDIARKLNASKGTISDILKTFGLTKSMKEISEKKKTRELEKEKNKAKIIAEKRINQIKRRKFDPSYEEALNLRKEMTCREIGVRFGVSHVAVYKRFVKMGIM